jgi:hypothetical protein
MAKRSWVDGGTVLRRCAKEKQPCTPAVSVNERLKQGPPTYLRLPAKTQKIAGCLLPGRSPMFGAYIRQVVKPSQHPMSPPKPKNNYCQPAGNQPRSHEALRVYRHRCTMKALLPHLPALDAQEQGSYRGIHGVLKVGNQLDRQRRKSPPASAADKTRNRNAFLPELREQLNGISPVGGNLAIASLLTTDRTGRPQEREEIDLTGKKRFLVFPNRMQCVRVGKLNLSAPCPQGADFGLLKPLGLSPCGAWLFY